MKNVLQNKSLRCLSSLQYLSIYTRNTRKNGCLSVVSVVGPTLRVSVVSVVGPTLRVSVVSVVGQTLRVSVVSVVGPTLRVSVVSVS